MWIIVRRLEKSLFLFYIKTMKGSDLVHISNDGINLIKKYEGCKLTAYKCPAGVWTIGVGHTSGVTENMIITQAQADNFLKQDLVKFEKLVEKYDSKYHWTQNEFDALVSFAFNVGSINQLTANGTRTKQEIANKMLEYAKASGKTLSGLVKRRKDEQALFLSSTTTGGDSVSDLNPVLKIGDKGFDVRKLQSKLSSIGYSLSVDGDFGGNTLKIVKEFQKDAGLSNDGVVGEKTWKALDDIKIYSKLADGNKSISPNFKIKEFACQDGSDTIVLHTDFIVDKLQKIRSHFNKPVTINSAYRNPTHNKKVGGASNSYHVKGRAFDIVVKGVTPNEVAKYAQSIGIKGIIRYSWGVHVDSRGTKYWAVDNNGKKTTVNSF